MLYSKNVIRFYSSRPSVVSIVSSATNLQTKTFLVCPYLRIRPIACVSLALYSSGDWVMSGCTKIAWLATVRFAPAADSDWHSMMSALIDGSFWKASMVFV